MWSRSRSSRPRALAKHRQVTELANDIDRAIEATQTIFGKDAFQRFERERPVGRFNRAVFDVMVMTLRFDDVREAAFMKPEKVKSAFVKLMQDSDFSGWTEATTKSKEAVVGRVEKWAKVLGRTLSIPALKDAATAGALEQPID